MIIGYARVSTEDQDLGRQVSALEGAGCQKIYMDKISGSKQSRPELDLMFNNLQPGDVVVVQKLDRLGRSLKHLIGIIEDFKKKGVGFRVIDGSIDTTTPQGELVFHIIGAIAQFERALIQGRTKDALAYKKSIGVQLGRPKVDNSSLKSEFDRLVANGMQREEIRKKMNLSMYKYYNLANQ